MLYIVKGREMVPTDDLSFENNRIYIIIDKRMEKATIWIWTGSEATKVDKYHAGVSATKIKSKEKLYNASIEIVESGNEPENFPKLTEEDISEPKALILEQKQADEIKSASVSPELQVKSAVKPTSEISQPKPLEPPERPDLLSKKVRSFLEEISHTIETLQNQIKKFLADL